MGEMYMVFVQAETRFLDSPYHRGSGSVRQQVDEIARKLRSRGVTILFAEKHPFAGGKDYYALYFEESRLDEGRTRGPLAIVGIAIMAVMSIFPFLRFGFWVK